MLSKTLWVLDLAEPTTDIHYHSSDSIDSVKRPAVLLLASPINRIHTLLNSIWSVGIEVKEAAAEEDFGYNFDEEAIGELLAQEAARDFDWKLWKIAEWWNCEQNCEEHLNSRRLTDWIWHVEFERKQVAGGLNVAFISPRHHGLRIDEYFCYGVCRLLFVCS